MSSAWAIVTAALGAASLTLLTSLGSLGVVGYQERRRGRADDRDALHQAVLEIWTRWDQEGIRLANDLVGKCMDLLDTCLATAPADTLRQWLLRGVIGERWAPQMEEAHERALKEMGAARLK
jgi:hypothetical protein